MNCDVVYQFYVRHKGWEERIAENISIRRLNRLRRSPLVSVLNVTFKRDLWEPEMTPAELWEKSKTDGIFRRKHD